MVADPGHGEIGDRLLVLAEAIEGVAVLRRDDQVLEGEHDALRPTGRAGCVEQDGKIAPRRLRDRGEPARFRFGALRETLPSRRLHRVEGVEMRRIVAPKAPLLVVDDRLQARQPRRRSKGSCRPAPGPPPPPRRPRSARARRPSRRRRNRHRAARALRRATEPRRSPNRAAAGSARRSRPCRRGKSRAPEGPTAKARTSSSTSAQVHVCHMPRSFWRMAGRPPRILALRRSSFGNVSSRGAATASMTFPTPMAAIGPLVRAGVYRCEARKTSGVGGGGRKALPHNGGRRLSARTSSRCRGGE